MPRISQWKGTPLVIGVKENMPPVRHEVLCGTHSSSQTQTSVTRLLNHSSCHLLPTLCTTLMPSFLIIDFIFLCVTEGKSNELLLLIRPVSVFLLRCWAAADGESIHQVRGVSCNSKMPQRDLETLSTNTATKLGLSHTRRLEDRFAEQWQAAVGSSLISWYELLELVLIG